MSSFRCEHSTSLVCDDAFRPSQQFFSHVWMFTCLPGNIKIEPVHIKGEESVLLKNTT